MVMGRRIPYDKLLSIHPVLYFSFFAAGLAASIAVITAMCFVVSFRRKQPSPPPTPTDPLETSKELDASSPPPSTTTDTEQSPPEQPQIEKRPETEDNEEVKIAKELPLPPAMQKPKDSLPSNNVKRAVSERRGSFSLSMKMPRALSVVARNWDQKEDNIEGQMKAEDPVWMKTKILGEKCVPGEEDRILSYMRARGTESRLTTLRTLVPCRFLGNVLSLILMHCLFPNPKPRT